jgi:phosphate transport system permease protein
MSAHGASLPSGLGRSSRRARTRNQLFRVLLFACVGVAIAVLGILIFSILTKGLPRLNAALFQRYPSVLPGRAGARSAILGTLWIMGLTAMTCIPLGVGAAVYLEEVANRERWYNRMIEVNIQNLAAVPSIVYGILGLAFLVRGLLKLGPSILAAALTLALLVLPIVIISSREAIRAVPQSIRHAALAVGATPWQTIRAHVLPLAVSGIATGSILALSRAIGEAAPLLLVGGLTFITFDPTGLDSAFAALPVQIYSWFARPQADFKIVAAAAIIVLLAILLTMNSVAIWLRNRFQTRW